MSAHLADRPPAVARAGTPVREGLAAMLPIAVAVAPFGFVVGVALAQTDVDALPALAATALVYGGSAQLAAISAILTGTGVVGAVLAGLVVNTRLVLYSAAFGHRFRDGQPGWFRWLAPLTTVDQTFALAGASPHLTGAAFRRYWVSMGMLLGAVWLMAVGVGMALGGVLAQEGSLRIAGPATMVALLVPHLRSARLRRAALVAACIGLAGRAIPSGVVIVGAIVAGLAVAGPGAREDVR